MKRFHPNIINKEGSSDVHLSYPFKDKFNCPICKKDYQFHSFKRHSKTMHPNHIFNLIISCSVCQLEFSNPRVASNHFTTHKGSHKKKGDTAKAPNFKNLLNYSDVNNEFNPENVEEGIEGVSDMSRLHPVADLNDPLSLSPITSSPSKLSDSILPSPIQLNPLVIKDNNIPVSTSIAASSIQKVANLDTITTPKAMEIVEDVRLDGSSMNSKNTAEENTKEQFNRIKELGVDINAMLEDLVNDPTPVLSPSSPIRMHGDTSLSPLSSPTLVRQIHEIREENDQHVFSPPVVAPYPPQPVMPAQPENVNGDDMINTFENNNIDNTPQHVNNNDAEANNFNEPNFNQHWLNKLSQADSWENFETILNDFTEAALEKARLHNNYNINNNRPCPQPRPNNVPPRAIN